MGIFITIVSLLLMVLGFLGIVLPFLPDIILIFIGALTYGVFSSFEVISMKVIAIFAVLTALSFLIDIISSVIGAKTQKASKYGQIGAVLGGIIGIFTSGIYGIILGPVLGVIGFEMFFAKKKFDKAINAGLGALLGFVFGSLLKVVIAVFMIGWFIKLII
jgi:hypothetical protein